jgi:hypothetical protein
MIDFEELTDTILYDLAARTLLAIILFTVLTIIFSVIGAIAGLSQQPNLGRLSLPRIGIACLPLVFISVSSFIKYSSIKSGRYSKLQEYAFQSGFPSQYNSNSALWKTKPIWKIYQKRFTYHVDLLLLILVTVFSVTEFLAFEGSVTGRLYSTLYIGIGTVLTLSDTLFLHNSDNQTEWGKDAKEVLYKQIGVCIFIFGLLLSVIHSIGYTLPNGIGLSLRL